MCAPWKDTGSSRVGDTAIQKDSMSGPSVNDDDR